MRAHNTTLPGLDAMTYRAPARIATRRIPRVVVTGLLIVIAAIVGVLGYQMLAPSSSTAAPPSDVPRSHPGRPLAPGGEDHPPLDPRAEYRNPLFARAEPRRELGEADGAIPAGTTVFDDDIQGVANLDPSLLRALRQAATDAADDGVEFVVNSGWRSPEYQEQLLDGAVSEYGSEREAIKWVATPNTSAHVTGDAVDIGPVDAREWLSEHGASYGLCQIYGNESWHYELHPEAIDHGCPPMYADPTRDPRMQQ